MTNVGLVYQVLRVHTVQEAGISKGTHVLSAGSTFPAATKGTLAMDGWSHR